MNKEGHQGVKASYPAGAGMVDAAPCDASPTWRNSQARNEFEMILTDLSAHFINIAAEDLDSAIEDAQRRVCEHLGVDLCSLWRIPAHEPTTFRLTHYFAPQELPPLPEAMDASQSFPWSLAMMNRGESLIVSKVEDAPTEAARDRENWEQFGAKSILTFPLSIGGGAAFGALNFCRTREERAWDPQLVSRLNLVAQIFANALARQETERALMETRDRLLLATAAADSGLWVLDGGGTTFWVTEKTLELFGLPPGPDLEVKRFVDLVHPDDRQAMQAVINEVLNSTEMKSIEYRIVRPDGAVSWMRSCGRMTVQAPLRPARLMGTTTDITARKKAEMDNQALRQELAHVSRVYTLGELASSMAHELNQPLGAIMTNADAAEIHLHHARPDLAEIQNILNDIRRDGLRAGDTIHRMRAFLQRREIEMKSFDVEQLVRESLQFVSADAGARKVTLRSEIEPVLHPGHGDRIQLQQVILNLMVNGMDAMHDSPPDARPLTVSARRVSADRIEISVADQGVGIPPERLAKVFEPFITTKRSGLGMGLTISRTIVEAHGGRLSLENNPRGGATARFTIPMEGATSPP
jgi:PAS domain S-box-containing protein